MVEVYSYNAAEFKAALKGLHWPADTCTPRRHQANGIAERALCRVREGAGASLLQAWILFGGQKHPNAFVSCAWFETFFILMIRPRMRDVGVMLSQGLSLVLEPAWSCYPPIKMTSKPFMQWALRPCQAYSLATTRKWGSMVRRLLCGAS